MSCTITIVDFQIMFDRGQFTFSEVLPDVRDKDITEAIAEANCVFNQDLYPDDDICTKALLYLTAHFLKLDIDMADSEGQTSLLQSSRSVGSISESVAIPEWMLQGDFAQYTTTAYGVKFITISKPYMDGAVYSVSGGTNF